MPQDGSSIPSAVFSQLLSARSLTSISCRWLPKAVAYTGLRMTPTHMSLQIIGIAILVSLFTGVVSGFFPAWRAARMNPVDALRAE